MENTKTKQEIRTKILGRLKNDKINLPFYNRINNSEDEEIFYIIKKHFVWFCKKEILTEDLIIKYKEMFSNNDIFCNTKTTSGYVLITKGKFTIDGDTIAVAKNDAKVWCYDVVFVLALDNTTVLAHDNTTVLAHDNTTVLAIDYTTVEALDNTTVLAIDYTTVLAIDYTTVEALDNTNVLAYDSSKVEAFGNSEVGACDNVTVEKYDKAIVQLYDNAKLINKNI